MTSWECDRCVIIPDVHQDARWVERIFARERARASRDLVVFLGDYFDSRAAAGKRAGAAETCEFLLKTRAELGERCVFLLGNHDIQYLEAKPACDARRTPRYLFNKCGAAYSHSTARKVADGLPRDFWTGARLFACVNGWLLSHAGLAARFWPGGGSVAESLEALDERCRDALARMRSGPQDLLEAGYCRGGMASAGGITWQDWNIEFKDALPLPQIVGHTGDLEAGARRKGRSWCIDCVQTCYAVLDGDEFQPRVV